MTLRGALSLTLLLGACSPASPISRPESTREVLPAGENAPRAIWKRKIAELEPAWTRAQLDLFLDRIRIPGCRRPRQAMGGRVEGTGSIRTYDRYPLDETFELYVVWKEPGKGILSSEVVGFADLRDRIDPALYPAMEALNRAPDTSLNWDYDPVLLIRAVNALQALGDRAISVMSAYHALVNSLSREVRDKYGLNVLRIDPVLRLLYGRRSGDTGLGLPSESLADPGPQLWPLFPFILEEDHPFLVDETPGVLSDPASSSLPRSGLRLLPLSPGLDPVEAVERLTASPRWTALLNAADPRHPRPTARQATQLRLLVRQQALQALSPIYTPPATGEALQDCCRDPEEARWARIVQDVRELGIRWDPGRQDFVRSR